MSSAPTPPIRQRLAVALSSRNAFFAMLVLVFGSSYFGAVASLIGCVIALVTLWARRWDWPFFGLARPQWSVDVSRAIKYTLVIIVVVDIVTQPIVDRAIGASSDLSVFEFLKGNISNLLLSVALMWVVAAFGEELYFRGYLVRGFARILGDRDRSWILGASVSTVLFGLVHIYQGASGVINTAMVGAILAIQFYRGRDRLVSCVLTHGFYDTIGLTLLYVGKSDAFANFLF